jgi:hypothetical protein
MDSYIFKAVTVRDDGYCTPTGLEHEGCEVRGYEDYY